MFKVICIFGHVLTVDSRYYGRCYVKNLIPLCTFLKFHAHVNECSRVLNLVFSRKWNIQENEHRYIFCKVAP